MALALREVSTYWDSRVEPNCSRRLISYSTYVAYIITIIFQMSIIVTLRLKFSNDYIIRNTIQTCNEIYAFVKEHEILYPQFFMIFIFFTWLSFMKIERGVGMLLLNYTTLRMNVRVVLLESKTMYKQMEMIKTRGSRGFFK